MPRQITSFEFKLIGFLTLKQFIYLAVFIPMGFIAFKLVPIPILNILFGIIVAGGGVAFAFVPINDRPLDVWIKNFVRRITSPTQFTYHKKNPPIYFLRNLYFVSDPHRVMSHIDSQEKLAAYMATKQPTKPAPAVKKQAIANLLHKPKESLMPQKKVIPVKPITSQTTAQVQPKQPVQQQIKPQQPVLQQAKGVATAQAAPQPAVKKAFFTGVVKNHRLIPLPGVLIYVRDDKGAVKRLLKTNPHGVFATFNPLPPAEYSFEFKDPKSSYFFDTMKLKIGESNPRLLEFFSKELL